MDRLRPPLDDDLSATASRPASSAAASPVAASSVAGSSAGEAAVGDAGAGTTYGPISHFLRRDDVTLDRARVRASARLGFRVRNDTYLMLAIAIAIPVLVMEAASRGASSVGLLSPVLFVASQLWLATLRSSPGWLPTARLAMSVAFIGSANLWGDPTGTWPLSALAVPVVALAAATGGAGPTAVAVLGMVFILAPLALPTLDAHARQEVSAVAMAAVVVAIGSRRVVANLERSGNRLRLANLRARRRARELAAVESVGSLLTREGLTAAALDGVMGLLETTFGYRYPSVYIWDGSALQLGAQRNYDTAIPTIAPGDGILGRVAGTHKPVFLPDVRKDAAFVSAEVDVVSEICIPLLSDGELLGALNVETSGDHRLDDDDFSTMQIVADRLSVALALGRERQKLTERAALLDRLTTFATVLGSSLDPATMDEEVASGAATVIPADSVVLTNRDELSGDYVINAIHGGDKKVVGQRLKRGEGAAGRAISGRAVVVEDRLDRASWPKTVTDAEAPDVVAAMVAPMVAGDIVAGTVGWYRNDLTRTFTAQEREVAALLASKVGLALVNARLHQQTRNAAITDPLTGIHNRRHFDAAVEREDALRRRVPAEKRRRRSAILFDLDHFGRVNKQYGHQVGDRVLRLFADTLTSRARASDLVARYGGEEFVVILDNASREDAAGIADAVRTEFARHTIDTGTGTDLTTTVSAGCSTLEAWEVESAVLLERADVALAMAKAAGRDQVVTA